MAFLYFQTFLILLLAYLLGALFGCFLRHFFPADHVTDPRTADTRPNMTNAGIDVGIPNPQGGATASAGFGSTIGNATIAAGGAAAGAGAAVKSTIGGIGGNPVPKMTTPHIPQSHIPTPPPQPVVPPKQVVVPPAPTPPVVERPTIVPTPKMQTPATDHSDFLTERGQAGAGTVRTETVSRTVTNDDLTQIKGLGSILALKLNKIGITRFDQIARWTQNDIKNVNMQLEFSGRVEREDWIGQAQRLLQGKEAVIDGTTAHVTSKTQKKAFPSIQKEINLDAVSSQNLPVSGPADDLKRIAGVGVVLEQQLNELGYTHFEHIENLTPYDIRRISEHLEFTGRIEREDWMGQAERLAKTRL